METEADIRSVQARYLCDTPCPEARRRRVGKAARREHFEAFWGRSADPAPLLNVRYLTSE